MRASDVRDVAAIIIAATTSGSAPTSGRITSGYPTSRTGSCAGFAASVVRISGRTFRRVAWAPPMMWRMLNAEAVIFMGWNAGTDRRLDRLRTIAAALAGGLGLEAAHENHRG
jgi:hypothetical protein